MLNILLSSVGRRSYLAQYFREALNGDGKVVGTNCVPDSPGLHAVDIPIVVPAAWEGNYVSTMLTICRDHDVRLVFSLHDAEAPYLAAEKALFEEIGTTLVLPDSHPLSTCVDKYRMTCFACEHGLRTPMTLLGLESAKKALSDGTLEFPVVVKPRQATGSLGLFFASSVHELEAYTELCRREIVRSPFLSKVCPDGEEKVIVQQMIQGQEYGLNVLNDLNRQFAACYVVRKLRMYRGETDAAETEHSPPLEDLGRTIAHVFEHRGLVDVDVMLAGGTPFIIDVNPRFGGLYPFAHMAGANAPAALVAWAKGEVPNSAWLRTTPNVRGFKDIAIVRCS